MSKQCVKSVILHSPFFLHSHFLFLELRVLVEPHGLVLEAPVEVELVTEVRIQNGAAPDPLDEAALAQREDVLRAQLWGAEDNDLGVRALVRLKHACDFRNGWEKDVPKSSHAPRLRRPSRRVGPERVQRLRERRRHHDIGVRAVEVIAAGRHA